MSMSSLKYFGNIGEWSVDMNKQMRTLMLFGMMILLLTACGRFETAPMPVDLLEIPLENPTDTSEPVSALDDVDYVPTANTDGAGNADDGKKYIGLIYLSLPEGLTQGFSMVIWGKDGYGLSMILEGANKMLWLEKIAHNDGNGAVAWEVKDVLALSNLESGLTLLPDGCSLNGTPDSEILVVAKNGVIVLAWRANTTLEKFEVIPANGITCDTDKAMPLE